MWAVVRIQIWENKKHHFQLPRNDRWQTRGHGQGRLWIWSWRMSRCQKRVRKISQINRHAYLKRSYRWEAIATSLSTLIISKEVQNEKKWQGDSKVPGWDVVGALSWEVQPCWRAAKYDTAAAACKSARTLWAASPFLGIYPKETIKHEPKAIHGSVT